MNIVSVSLFSFDSTVLKTLLIDIRQVLFDTVSYIVVDSAYHSTAIIPEWCPYDLRIFCQVTHFPDHQFPHLVRPRHIAHAKGTVISVLDDFGFLEWDTWSGRFDILPYMYRYKTVSQIVTVALHLRQLGAHALLLFICDGKCTYCIFFVVPESSWR